MISRQHPTEKEVRNPSIAKAFRQIGLSDQAGTGIRAIFRNWHDLGRVPPQLRNNKARKEFELELLTSPLITPAMQRFRQAIEVNLARDQAEVLALALGQQESECISLTDIRGLGISTTQQAKQVAEGLIRQQLLQPVSETQFEVPEALRRRFTQVSAQVTPHVAPQVTPQVTPQVLALLEKVSGEMPRHELMETLGLKDRKHFGDAYLQPALEMGVLEMKFPDRPQSSKQRYRLTELGQASKKVRHDRQSRSRGEDW